jgi:hypothetical protein
VPLYRVAHARSGDKGDASNVGLLADSPRLYEVLRREVTAERVKEHFRQVCRGPVERFEVPNLLALNFLLHDSLGGGGTLSLKSDAQGKTHGQGLLTMEIEVPDELVPAADPMRTGAGVATPARDGGAGAGAGATAGGAPAGAGSPEALKGI